MISSMVRIEWGAEGRGWQVFGAAGMELMATITLLKKASVEVDCRAAIDWFG
jgi:hypothetical protein